MFIYVYLRINEKRKNTNYQCQFIVKFSYKNHLQLKEYHKHTYIHISSNDFLFVAFNPYQIIRIFDLFCRFVDIHILLSNRAVLCERYNNMYEYSGWSPNRIWMMLETSFWAELSLNNTSVQSVRKLSLLRCHTKSVNFSQEIRLGGCYSICMQTYISLC